MSRGYLYAIQRLQNILTNGPLEKYYNLPDNFKIKTNCSEQANNIILSILYYSYPEFSKIKELPFEISCIIHSYLYNKIEINILIIYPLEYPFVSPIWTLINVKHNFKTLLNLNKYYKYLIDTHNHKHLKYWSPAITIASNILEFIQQINHIEYILSYS